MERKLATVLFADLVGSTAMGAELDPEYARDLLERFYDAMEAEIALGGGTVEKFIGDAVVAVFGAPVAQEDHAERALQTALWMLERLHELFADRLALRIGVNTGEIVVGRTREGSSFATGDAVNVAARLEQAAVGRASELAWLQRMASTEEPRLALLVGDPGLGSSSEHAPHRTAKPRHARSTRVLDRRFADTQTDAHLQLRLRPPIAALDQLLHGHRTPHRRRRRAETDHHP
ncbi:MAG: adenylate/guanylate cyclase domain-containing protein, partial [Gaiella sp.]|uniref:adenylate/guanylate cyclase domain-containing protein n=1 Tax=Gaiella sp. TaxID=2663207 RepID=UPI003C737BD1